MTTIKASEVLAGDTIVASPGQLAKVVGITDGHHPDIINIAYAANGMAGVRKTTKDALVEVVR